MEKFTVPDGVRNLPFMGVKLSEINTDEKKIRLRWTELTLFRLATDVQVEILRDNKVVRLLDEGQSTEDIVRTLTVTEARVERAKERGTRDPGEPDGKYLVHSMGRSLVYHKDVGGCGKGTRTDAGKLSRDMEPCEDCWPDDPDVLYPGMTVRAEIDRGFAVLCDTAQDVVEALEEMTRRLRGRHAQSGPVTTPMSGPAAGLLANAADKDPAIALLVGKDVPLTPLM